jgi:hypothetical protein
MGYKYLTVGITLVCHRCAECSIGERGRIHGCNIIVISAYVLLLSGCVTPYQPNGFAGGYTDFETQPGIYYVSFQGNGYTSKETAAITASATPVAYRLDKSTSAPEERGIRGFRRHAEWPKVTDLVIEADHYA